MQSLLIQAGNMPDALAYLVMGTALVVLGWKRNRNSTLPPG